MIETSRLILRPFREEDAEDVLDYLQEPMVNCFARMKVHSLVEARKVVMERASLWRIFMWSMRRASASSRRSKCLTCRGMTISEAVKCEG